MAHLKLPQTPGGLRLRGLRESRGKSQLDVELDASLGLGYLQRLELGKVSQPEHDTLNRILDALGAHFNECREVLALFGYTAPITLPDEAEIRWAVEIFCTQVKGQTLPAYLLDCGHRLLAWNPQAARVFHGLNTGVSLPLMPRLIFDPNTGISANILNADAFYAAQVRVLHYERQRCGSPALHTAFVDEMKTIPTFARCWEKMESSEHEQVPVRPLVPMQLTTPQGRAQFRLMAENFAHDPRFRIIYYLPDDAATMRLCAAWLTPSEEANASA